MNCKATILKFVNDNDPEEFLNILKKPISKKVLEDLFENVSILSNKQLDHIWNGLQTVCTSVLVALINEEISDEKAQLLNGITVFGNICLNEDPQAIPDGLRGTAHILQSVLTIFPDSSQTLKKNIIEFYESWWFRDCPGKEEFAKQLMLYHIEIISSNTYTKSDLKQIISLKECLKSIDYRDTNEDSEDLLKFIKKSVQSSSLIEIEEGKYLLRIFLGLDVNLTKDIHRIIKMKLSTCSRIHCKNYGEVYFKAWNSAEDEIKKVLETYCIQDVMYHTVHAVRDGLHPVFQNLKMLLDYFHKRKNITSVNNLLFTLYQPILWRSLKVPNSDVRANAACIFFDTFPFENVNDDKEKNESFLQKQFDLMQDLIIDSCPSVRIIAITGVCNLCNKYWMLFPVKILSTLLCKLIDDLANDVSSYEVRIAVFKGISNLLDNPLSWRFLKKALINIRNNFHDVVENVRIAVLELLLKLKNIKEFQFWKIVPTDHLLSRLAIESPPVAKRIVSLLFSSYHPPDKSDFIILQRCVDLVRCYRVASRKFYFYAHQLMDVNTAVSFLLILLKSLKNYSIKKLTEKKNENSCSSDSDEDKENEERSINISSSLNPLDDPAVQAGLFDIIAIIWTGIQYKIQEPRNAEYYNKLKEKFKSCMLPFFRHYKETPSWDSLLYIASFVPPSSVQLYSKYCLSKLRNLSNDQSKNQTIVKCLCKWNLIDDMIEIISSWLTAGLKMGRNSSGKRSCKRKCVKFREPCDPQPIAACDMIISILSDPVCRNILIENKNQLSYFMTQLWTILKVIESHLKSTNDLNIYCTEEFLQKAFLALCRTNILLHGDEEMETAISHFQEILSWVCQEIVPLLGKNKSPTGKHSFIASNVEDEQTLLNYIINVGLNYIVDNVILEAAHDMTVIGMVNGVMCNSLSEFIEAILDADEDCSFLLNSTKTLYQLVEFSFCSEYVKEADKYVNIISVAFGAILRSLVKKVQQNNNVRTRDDLKIVLLEIFNSVFTKWASNSKITKDIISSSTAAVISNLTLYINEKQGYEACSSIYEFPCFSAYMLSLLLSKKTFFSAFVGEIKEMIKCNVLKETEGKLAIIALLHMLSQNVGSHGAQISSIIRETLGIIKETSFLQSDDENRSMMNGEKDYLLTAKNLLEEALQKVSEVSHEA